MLIWFHDIQDEIRDRSMLSAPKGPKKPEVWVCDRFRMAKGAQWKDPTAASSAVIERGRHLAMPRYIEPVTMFY
jgi:hypothetical protein